MPILAFTNCEILLKFERYFHFNIYEMQIPSCELINLKYFVSTIKYIGLAVKGFVKWLFNEKTTFSTICSTFLYFYLRDAFLFMELRQKYPSCKSLSVLILSNMLSK